VPIPVSVFTSAEEHKDFYIFGSSLAQLAFCEYKSLDSAIARSNACFSYKIFYKPGALIGDFDDIIPEIRQVNPPYLLIESNIMCLDMFGRMHKSSFSFPKRYASIIRKRINKHFVSFIQGLSFLPPEIIKAFENSEIVINEKYWHSYKKHAEKYQVLKIDDFPQWNTFFQQARKNGMRIFFLEFPRSLESAQYFPQELRKSKEQLIAKFTERFQIELISFPHKWDQKTYFIDAVHLNEKGANFYSSWLLQTMQNVIKQSH
jgi:hypothetical protein